MAIQTKTVEVGDKSYMITAYNAKTGLKYFMQLVKKAGPLLSALASGGSTGSIPMMEVAEVLDVDGMDNLVIEMFNGHVADENGKEIMFSTEFAANYGAMVKVFVEILKLNYSSFLSEGGLNLSLGQQI